MSTNCELIQELLPAYAESDLGAEERARVDAHLNGCPDCQSALRFFSELETSLVARRDLRPSARHAANDVVRRLGLKRPWYAWPGLIVPASTFASMPFLISAALIVFGVFTLVNRQAIAVFFQAGGVGLTTGVTKVFEKSLADLSTVPGGDFVIPIVYAGVVALILFSGSFMVLRYVREE